MYLHSHLLVNMFLDLANDSQIICAVMPTGKKCPLEICANDCQLSCHCHMKNLQLSLKQHQLVALLVSLQHLLNQCWNSSIPVAIDGGVVVQFGTRPRRRRLQQSFGSIWVTRLYGHYIMILVMCMIEACFSLFPRSILISLGQMYMPLKVLFFLYNHQ